MTKSPYPQIDKLRKKFDTNKPLSLREACSILWLECYVETDKYLVFASWVKRNKLPSDTKLGWLIWKSMYNTFMESEYTKLKSDVKLFFKERDNGKKYILSIKL